MSRLAVRPTQPPVQWGPGDLLLGAKWPVCEASHSSPSSARIKNVLVESYLHSPIHLHGMVFKHRNIFMVWYLAKNRDSFTFTSTLLCFKFLSFILGGRLVPQVRHIYLNTYGHSCFVSFIDLQGIQNNIQKNVSEGLLVLCSLFLK
jgi:hypothetical protein